MPADLDEYRVEAECFLAALEEELYLHFSGRKEALELEPIHKRFADLTTLEACRELSSAPVELRRFACERYLGRLTREQEERIAGLETTLEAEVDGERIGFRMLHPRLANEPERGRRERIERARCDLVQVLNPLYLEAWEQTHDAVRELGAPTYRELYEGFGFSLETLAGQCSRFLDETEEPWASAFDRLLRDRVGVGLDKARRSDLPRVIRAAAWDEAFPADRMLPALEATLADFGIDLQAQRNVHLDIEWRPTKSPRAFCSPIEVPGRVVLVIQPIGGLDDWCALFHEAGHLEHFANTSAHLPFEVRRLGDNAVSEGWAFLLEHLVTDAAWLGRRLDVARPQEIAHEAAVILLYYTRRLCGKLLYELELHSGAELAGAPDRYVDWMREATKIEWAEADFLADVDPGFYCSSYLRAWALEAQLARHLRAEFGRAWFADRKAGSLLRELWSEGQGMTADEIAWEVTGTTLELDAVAEAIRQAL